MTIELNYPKLVQGWLGFHDSVTSVVTRSKIASKTSDQLQETLYILSNL